MNEFKVGDMVRVKGAPCGMGFGVIVEIHNHVAEVILSNGISERFWLLCLECSCELCLVLNERV